tara:strand:+ start:57 stop:452 length:396 start_codon:yes stop_codon:yes gene_type:complete
MTELSTSQLTSEFWDRAKSKKLVRPVCDNCGNNFFSPQLICPDCHQESWSYQESSGEGEIYSYTVIHRPPDTTFPSPLIVADIELDEGWRMFSWIIESDPTEVDIGRKVNVCFEEFSGRTLPVFTLKKDDK